MKLVIVESPAKAKTIKGFLDKNYIVTASKGHIRDLPQKKFGIKVTEKGGFEPEYEVADDHKAIVTELKKLAKDADEIFLATDEDREGEAIAWHIAHALGKKPEKLPRIVFHEITKKAITHALEAPRGVDFGKVNAQQTRRLLDRIVGYKLSPLIGTKIQRGLSAGRVQSAALKLVVDREREIKAFQPVEYYQINALFEKKLEAELYEFDGKKMQKLSVNSAEFAKTIEKAAKSESFVVSSIESKTKALSPNAPFMTSTLQQSASSALSFSPKKTMSVAQKLYEGVKTFQGESGVITYMRTDSLNIAAEAQAAAKKAISERFGDEYVPSKPRVYKTKNQSAQEAHEAIRPTMLDFTPEIAAKYLKPDELKLYTLIYNRFLASQMADAKVENQTVLIGSKSCVFKASGRKILFEGFYKAFKEDDDKDKILPHLEEKQPLKLENLSVKQKFTEPPARFSEASLVKTMEALGIGRPSTYAPTIATLEDRKYILIENRQLMPSESAFLVTELLEQHFEEIVNSNFTAGMEEELDKVEKNEIDWQVLLKNFYDPFMAKIAKGKTDIKSQKVVVPLDRNCPNCGEVLVQRAGRFGEFISCSTYPKCKYSEALGKPKEPPKSSGVICDKCGGEMVIKSSFRGEFLACSNYPACKNTKSLKEPESSKVPCPKCGGKLLKRVSKRGAFFGCANYPKCDFVSKYEPTDIKCEECGGVTVLKELKTKKEIECLSCKHKAPVA